MSSPSDLAPATPEPSASSERARAARATIDALTSNRDVFETFFDAARIGLALADLSGRYVRVNDTYAALLGRPPEDLIGVPISEVLVGEDADSVGELLAGRSTSAQTEQQYVRPDGRALWVLHGVAAVTGSGEDAAWYAVSAQDITERRRAEQDLRELTAVLSERAVRDPLTGLANRSLLEERLRASVSRDARTAESTGLLFLDLDGFKEVNDRHGHAVGDRVLRTVAERLSSAVRPSDTVARLGGDEFVVLVESAGQPALDALVARLEEAVRAPVALPGLDLEVGVSIGVALSRCGEQSPQALLAQADRRMYEAKRRAR